MEILDFEVGYYYLHINSQIIWKPRIVVESDLDYFNSPFVVKHWKVENNFEFQKMKSEAKAIDSGA